MREVSSFGTGPAPARCYRNHTVRRVHDEFWQRRASLADRNPASDHSPARAVLAVVPSRAKPPSNTHWRHEEPRPVTAGASSVGACVEEVSREGFNAAAG